MQGFSELAFESKKCAGDIYGLAITGSGESFVLGHYRSQDGNDGTNISKWDIAKKEKEQSLLEGQPIRYPEKLLISDAGDGLFFLDENGSLHYIDLNTMRHEQYGYEGITDFSLSATGLLALSGKTTVLVDIKTKTEIHRFTENGAHVLIDKQGTRVFAANIDPGEILIFDLTGMTVSARLDQAPVEIISACLDPSDRYYYCQSQINSGESIWDLAANRLVFQKMFKASSGPPDPKVAFHPHLPIIASGSERGLLMLLDLANETILSMQSLSEFPVRALAFTPDGARLLVACGDGLVYFVVTSSLHIKS